MTLQATRNHDVPNRAVGWLPRLVLVAYLLTVTWLTLFKLSYDIPAILTEQQTRRLNLIPFAGIGGADMGGAGVGLGEMVSNVITFIPFGLLLAVNVKQAPWWRLAGLIAIFSLSVETLQYVLAIGATDVTDVATNTLGGLAGLILYRLADLGLPSSALDRIIAVAGAVVFLAFLLLRLFVFQVRY